MIQRTARVAPELVKLQGRFNVFVHNHAWAAQLASSITCGSEIHLPGQRKYPMEDRAHQIKAEEFATKDERQGKLSPARAARIRVKAKRLLGK